MGCAGSREKRRVNHIPIGACVRYIILLFYKTINVHIKIYKTQSSIEILVSSSDLLAYFEGSCKVEKSGRVDGTSTIDIERVTETIY